MYLAFVLDTYNRRLRTRVAGGGWSMGERMQATMVVDALALAVSRRRLDPEPIHHSDHGFRYISIELGRMLKKAGILPSMGSVVDAYNNAIVESFVSTLNHNLINRTAWPTREIARLAIFEYIEVF